MCQADIRPAITVSVLSQKQKANEDTTVLQSSNKMSRQSHKKIQIKHAPCELGGPGVLDGARLGLMGREGAEYSGTVGDWQGLVRGEELGEVPRPELEDGCRC